MPEGYWLLVVIVFCALAFDFINGFHDTANAIATVVSTRVMTPRTAIMMAAVLALWGALISTKVATTVAKGIADPDTLPTPWCWPPSSEPSSGTDHVEVRESRAVPLHALIGGLRRGDDPCGPGIIHVDG